MRLSARPWLFILILILSVFTLQTALLMTSLDGWYTRLPYWDQASHALDAMHFALALHNWSLGQFFVQLNESAMWPPAIPLLQAPFLVVFGENYGNVRTWVAFCSVPAILMVFAVGVQSHRRFGILVGAMAASILAVAPGYLEFCMQEMLEIPGIMLSMLTLFFYLKFIQDQNPKDWLRTCATGLVLFFTKFNYAILIMLPIVVAEFAAQRSFQKQVLLGIFTLMRDIRWRSAFVRFVMIYGLFLLYISKVGLRFEFMGHTVLIERALGNPTYLLMASLIIRNMIVNRPLLARYGRAIWQAEEPVRSLLRFNILPALVWLSYPSFFRTFFIFLFSEKTRKSSLFSMETLSFYPSALLKSFTPHPLIGVAVLISLAVMLFLWRKLPRASRFMLGLTLFNLALTITHPNYQERYLLTSVPMLLITFGLALAHGLEHRLRIESARWDHFVNLLAAFSAFACLSFFAPKKSFLQHSLIWNTQGPEMGAAFAAICDAAEKAERNTLVGFSSPVAPAGIAITCYERHPKMRREQMPTTMVRHGYHGEVAGEKIVDSLGIDQFFVVDISKLGRGVGRLQEEYLLPGALKALPLNAHYAESLIHDFGPGGLRIMAYRLKPGSSSGIGSH